MIHSFFSSRFYPFTTAALLIFVAAAVVLMHSLHDRVRQTFQESVRTRTVDGASMLCLAGETAMDARLALIRQEMRELASAHGTRLLEADQEGRRRRLSRLTLHTAGAEMFFFLDGKPSFPEDGAILPPDAVASALDTAWSGQFALIGPYFDTGGKYRLCLLEPCFSSGGEVVGLLGAQLNAAVIHRWIRHLSSQGSADIACIFDRNGFPVAATAEEEESRIRSFHAEGRQGQFSGDLRSIRAAILSNGVSGEGGLLEEEDMILSWRPLIHAPWIFLTGVRGETLNASVTERVEKALRGFTGYVALLIPLLLSIVGLALFDAVRNRRLSLLLSERNTIISRQAEHLLASEKMFHYTLAQCGMRVIDYDLPSRRLTFYSAHQKEVFHDLGEEDWGALLLRGKTVTPEIMAKVEALIHAVSTGARGESCELRLYDEASGKEQWHRLSLSGMGDGTEGVQQRLIGIMEDISEAKTAKYDMLTRLYNRKTSEEMIRGRLASLPAFQPYAFLLLDVDHFKSVNDTFGHPIGDTVLERTAELLRASFREEDILGRLGGDEFCVFLSGEQLEKGRLESALISLHRKAHDILENPAGERPAVSFSCGAIFSRSRHTFEQLYMAADEALYRVKENGRDNFEIVVWDR